MKLSIISMLLNNDLNVETFKTIIELEISEYTKLMKKKGASNPIHLIEDIVFFLKKEHFEILCDLYINGELNEYEISYIADAISLSSNITFEDERILDALNEFSISDVDDILNKRTVLKYKNWILS